MNESINIGNYERFLIDFMDGTLDKEAHALVVLFLEQHPDIAEEFNDLSEFSLNISEDIRIDKESLIRNDDNPILIHNDNYEEFFIAYAEGDLSANEMMIVEDFLIDNPHLKNDFSIYQNLKLTIDNNLPTVSKEKIQRVTVSADKYILLDRFENLCIAFYEDDINLSEKMELESAISYSLEAKGIFESYAAIKYNADASIVYPNKSSLKRRVIGVVPFSQIFAPSIAAAIAILIIFYVVSPEQINNPDYVLKYPAAPKYTLVPNSNIESADKADIQTKNIKTELRDVTKSNTEIVKAQNIHLTIIKPKNIDYRTSVELEMNTIEIPLEESYTSIDTGYFMVVGPPDEKVNNQEMPKGLRKVRQKIARIFKHETEVLKKESPKESIKYIAQIAMNGFNRMTEGGRSFGSISPKEESNSQEN